jgi:phosphoribosylaminoimidazole-succinocarboxamide synthase
METKTDVLLHPDLTLVHRGKVRDSYAVRNAADRLLIVATDRVSAFDVVMPETIALKGMVLTTMSIRWFKLLTAEGLIRQSSAKRRGAKKIACYHHFISHDPRGLNLPKKEADYLRGRSMLVKAADFVLPVECVVRGYLEGSGWKAYRETGKVCNIALPPGLRRCDKLVKPIFSPSTKAEPPEHDQNISETEMVAHLEKFFRNKGLALNPEKITDELKTMSLKIYDAAQKYARQRGIIIADTKFEFGLLKTDAGYELMLIDEVLTPDSSRFWDAKTYCPGQAQASFDKQPLRDWLETLVKQGTWNKAAPGPLISDEIKNTTSTRYQEILHRLFSP